EVCSTSGGDMDDPSITMLVTWNVRGLTRVINRNQDLDFTIMIIVMEIEFGSSGT
ncbi:hypothetical protein HAX54_023988, partial [Datura stramonium]|nr:hypothetical protein [Datura stramonium]